MGGNSPTLAPSTRHSWAAIAVPMLATCAVVLLVGAVLLAWLTEISFERSLFWVGIAGVSLAIGVTLAQWHLSTKSRGMLLLDFGAHPSQKVFLVNAVIAAFFAGSLTRHLTMDMSIAAPVVILGLVTAFFFIWMALGRQQIRENGLWVYSSLLNWDRIQDFHWQGESEANPYLVVDYQSKMPLGGRAMIPVAERQREEVDKLLRHLVAD